MKLVILSIFSVFLLLQSNVYADKLLVEAIGNEPPNSLEGIPRPKPGMTAKRVKEIFGKPLSVSEPVGNPPITRWQYKQFEVVYEQNYVINTVLKTPIEMFVSDQ